MRRPAALLLAAAALAACASSQSAPDPAPGSGQSQTTTRLDTDRGTVAITSYNERANSTATIEATPDKVWAVLPAVYQELGLEYTVIESSRFRIGNDALAARRQLGKTPLNRLFDCGTSASGPNAASYQLAISVFTRLAPSGTGQTTVVTDLEATGRPVNTSGGPVPCGSTRTLEKQIATLIQVKLKG